MASVTTSDVDAITKAAVSQITIRGNLRHRVGDTSELQASIAAIGLIEPLVVSANGKGFDLLAGHRRLEAVKALKWKTVPVHVLDVSDEDAEVARLAVQLVENLQRTDLDPIEEAQGYAQLKALGWKQTEIAKRIGRSQAHVSKRLSLLELPDRAFDLHDEGRLGSESLYELTKVVSAGGDLEPILDQLSDETTSDTPHRVEEVEHLVASAVRHASVESELAARIAELEAEGVRVLPAKYDPHGHPTLPKDEINSWTGKLAGLTPDNHAKEPCHGVCVYINWGSIRESYHCTDRRRHLADGASKLKVKKGSQKTDSEKIKETVFKGLRVAMAEAATEIMAGRAPARDKIIERLCTLYLGRLGANARHKAITLLDLESELTGDGYGAIEQLYADADTTNRVRILLAAVLADGHEISSSFHSYDDVRDPHLDFLAELGEPIDRVTIHPRKDL